MLIMAIIGLTTTLLALPFAGSIMALYALRFLMGASTTGHIAGTTTMMVDFPANETRGKFLSLMLIVQAVVQSALVGWLLPHTPAFLVAHGVDRVTALRCSLWDLAAIGVIGLIVAVLFLAAPEAGRSGGAHLRLEAADPDIAGGAGGQPGRSDFRLDHPDRLRDPFGLLRHPVLHVGVGHGASRLEGIASPQALETSACVQ